jgi:predicted amidohydrolase YtcJ
VPDHPVLVRRFCGHVAVANSAALALLGLADDTPDPDGGSFGRAPDGRLDGSGRESAAERMFRAAPPIARDDLVAALRGVIDDSARLGLVAAVEAAVGFTSGFDDEFAVWNEIRRGEPLPLRLGFMHQLDPVEARERGLMPARDADWQAMTLKYFADGIVGARTAAVSEDYADTQGRGFFVREEAELRRVIEEAHRGGWQVAVHCVGDRATSSVLDAYECAQAVLPRSDARHRIEHFFVPPVGGLARAEKLGVLVMMQPSFLTRMRRSILSAFGPRAQHCYPGRAVLDAGAVYVATSDAPTGAWSPWDGIADAVDRAADSGPPIGPAEAISVREAIHAYTVGGAYAMKQEHWRGTLAPGMAADLIALDRDPFAAGCPPLKATQVLLTMVRGEIVHDTMTQRGAAPAAASL